MKEFSVEIEKIMLKTDESLKIRRYSDATRKRYRQVLGTYLKYENKRGKDILQLNEYDALDYLNMLTEERNYKASSYNNVNAIIKYYLEVVLEKDIAYRRMPNAKIGYRRKEVATKEDYEKLLNESKTTREKSWIMLAYGSGLRVAEIAELKVESVDSENMKLIIVGKGNRERMTVLPIITLETLRKYCQEYKITKNDTYLFKSNQNEHISAATISYKIKELGVKCGLNKKISPHRLRAGFATAMLKMGEPVMVVQQLMGHTSPETTSKYAELVGKKTKIKNPLEGEFDE